ncbi:bifunctional DNA primase/polymerase [Streptomyces sp. NBC_01643]|uniref:bifunctional DNA primase/polymerase n=1 Tax=Streptomyces sp. NBC_01643 TaxID=2975906 RepID=UPI002F90C1D7|nr:bifunctional DNA primase/polymerase [Streptomyces sp. NBC_01643]
MPAELRLSCSDAQQSAAEAPVTVPSALTIAKWCASHRWPVHPLAPGRKTPVANCAACRRSGHTYRQCECLVAGRWCHGFRSATLDQARIVQWWGNSPEYGVGVACGPAGLVVIDIDAHSQTPPPRDQLLPGIPIPDQVDLTGLATGYHTVGILAALRNATSPADDTSTLRVRTPSGGLHVWYRAADFRRWHCSTGSGGGRALAWQVDVRAHGGYIIAPGTVTKAGAYTPIGEVREPAPLPMWLAQELERTGHNPTPGIPAPRSVPARARLAVLAAGGGNTWGSRALAPALAEVAACVVVAEGAGFSDKLNRAAFTAGGLVAAGHLTEEAAKKALRDVAEVARPGQERRAEQIIRSGMTSGARRPLNLRSRS